MRAAYLALPALVLVPGFAAESAAAALLPHRAVYDLSLNEATDRSGISGIDGRMVYEFSGSQCDGYTVKFRFVTRIDTDDMSRLTDQQTTTYEDAEGKTFRFVTKSFVDEILEREVRGTATAGGEETTVQLEKPQAQTLTLDATQFPTEHLKELLDKAAAGENFYQTTLFDGSEDADEVMMTTVIVGEPKQAAPDDPEQSAHERLAAESFWPVTIAYFGGAQNEGEEMPDYNISFKLHQSGVTRDLTMDYGDFSIHAKLVDLAMFSADKQGTACPGR